RGAWGEWSGAGEGDEGGSGETAEPRGPARWSRSEPVGRAWARACWRTSATDSVARDGRA
ncbi:hypothetical protein DTB58_04125, partial [Streptomyces griseus]|nr:hypothetical protein [Streptomyces griseus]